MEIWVALIILIRSICMFFYINCSWSKIRMKHRKGIIYYSSINQIIIFFRFKVDSWTEETHVIKSIFGNHYLWTRSSISTIIDILNRYNVVLIVVWIYQNGRLGRSWCKLTNWIITSTLYLNFKVCIDILECISIYSDIALVLPVHMKDDTFFRHLFRYILDTRIRLSEFINIWHCIVHEFYLLENITIKICYRLT